MIVDDRGKLGPALRRYAPAMECNGRRYINGSPAHQPTSPSQVGVFAVCKEVFVEELAVDRRVAQCLHTIERSSSAWAKYIFRFVVLSKVRLVCAAIQMSLVVQPDNASGIQCLAIQ